MNEFFTNDTLQTSYKKHVMHTYTWMFLGVFLTFIVAYTVGSNYQFLLALYSIPMMHWILVIAQLGVVIALSARLMKFKPTTVKMLFLAYSILTGITFSYLPILYGFGSIASAFLITCIFFASLVVIGHTTSLDLSKIGTIGIAGLMAMLVYTILALLFHWPINTFLYSFIGLILFVGITAWDAQKMRNDYMMFAYDESMLNKMSIYSALNLYLDFINIFLYILRIVGNRD